MKKNEGKRKNNKGFGMKLEWNPQMDLTQEEEEEETKLC